VAEAIYAAAHYAIKMNAMVLVHGPSGVGKSLTLSAIRAETPGSVLVPIRTGGESPRSIMEALGNACQISERSASMSHRWFLQLEKLLAGTNRLIMIDEAHKLIGRQRDKGLHILRDFYDATNCPMLICGTSDVMYYIQQGTAQHNEALDQLRGRIQCWVDLTERAGSGGDRGPRLATEQDVRMVLARFKMRLTPDAITYLKWLANEPGMGAMRSCVALVALAIELFGSDAEAITGDHLRRAQCVRMGSRAAQSIEDRREATPARAVKVG
jgi:DNA polymerase III delta prime subunit